MARLALLLVVAGCEMGERPAEVDENLERQPFVTLTRTGCFGSCPAYELEILATGEVRYQGHMHVKTEGSVSWLIDQRGISEIHALFRSTGYASMKSEYLDGPTDHSTTFLSYRAPGATTWKRVIHYHGDGSAPRGLAAIEDGIDGIVHIEEVIGTDAEPRAMKQAATAAREEAEARRKTALPPECEANPLARGCS